MNTTSAMDCGASSRTDDDLQFRVRLCLTRREQPALLSIEVEASEGVVTLRGSLPDLHLRRLALATVRHVAGVIQVCDRMRSVAPVQRKLAVGASRRRLSPVLAEWRIDS